MRQWGRDAAGEESRTRPSHAVGHRRAMGSHDKVLSREGDRSCLYSAGQSWRQGAWRRLKRQQGGSTGCGERGNEGGQQ